MAAVAWGLASGPGFSLRLLRFYPKRLGSQFAGWAAERTIPRWARGAVLGGFARHYQVDLTQAELPLEDYPDLQSFFTRRLKPGARPQDPPRPGAVNSPVDGSIIACGRISAGSAIQAKGLPYRVAELLKHGPAAERFEGGHYLTLYLSPRDYHRVHVPFTGEVTAVGRVEGELWPVNASATSRVPRLYERNRRAIWSAQGTGPDEGLDAAAVLVGATHVGGVEIDSRWRQGRALPKDGGWDVPRLPCRPGEELGAFRFGSTVVLLIGGPKSDRWVPVRSAGAVKVGERLGMFRE